MSSFLIFLSATLIFFFKKLIFIYLSDIYLLTINKTKEENEN